MKNLNKNKEVVENVGLGMQMAISLFLFVYAGYRLDVYLETLPLFILVGTFLGLIVAFYYLFNELKRLDSLDKMNKANNSKRKNDRNKWL